MRQKPNEEDMNREATIWYFRNEHGAGESGFDAWLAADENHRAVYEGVCAFMVKTEKFTDSPEMAEKYAHILQKRRPSYRGPILTAAISAVAAVFAIVMFYAPGPVAYQTEIGEQRQVTLEDGTIITLNTNSHISVDMSEQDRVIIFDHGQANFDVAKDKTRPFKVIFDQGEVIALGTSFDIYNKASGEVVVSLLEGSVKIRRKNESLPFEEIILTVADMRKPVRQVSLSNVAISDAAAPDREIVSAWQKAQFVVDGMALGDVVAEINRYSRQEIILGHPDLQGIMVTGVFPTDSQAALRIIENYFQIERIQGDGKIVLLPQGDREGQMKIN